MSKSKTKQARIDQYGRVIVMQEFVKRVEKLQNWQNSTDEAVLNELRELERFFVGLEVLQVSLFSPNKLKLKEKKVFKFSLFT